MKVHKYRRYKVGIVCFQEGRQQYCVYTHICYLYIWKSNMICISCAYRNNIIIILFQLHLLSKHCMTNVGLFRCSAFILYVCGLKNGSLSKYHQISSTVNHYLKANSIYIPNEPVCPVHKGTPKIRNSQTMCKTCYLLCVTCSLY